MDNESKRAISPGRIPIPPDNPPDPKSPGRIPPVSEKHSTPAPPGKIKSDEGDIRDPEGIKLEKGIGAEHPSVKATVAKIFDQDRFLPESQLKLLQHKLGIDLSLNTQFYIAVSGLTSSGAVGSRDLFKTILAVKREHPPELIIDSFCRKLNRRSPNFNPEHLAKRKIQAAEIDLDHFDATEIFALTTEVEEALAEAASLAKHLKHENSQQLSPVHVVAGLLKRQGGSLQTLLRDADLSAKDLLMLLIKAVEGFSYPRDEMARWFQFAESVTGIPFPREASGRESSYERDGSSDSLTPETAHYAAAIASTFRNSGKGDFSMALFGPWGRGKTTLIREVSELLSKKIEGKATYETVTFNAWKYPNRPEVWLHLYEEVKKKATGQSPLRALRLAVQSKLLADGGWPLLFPSMALLIASIPKLAFIQWLLPGLAILSGFLLLAYFKAFRSGLLPVFQSYLKLPDHSKNLGLQSTVGADLTRLLKVWVRGMTIQDRCKYFGIFWVSLAMMITSFGIIWSRLPPNASWLLEWTPLVGMSILTAFGAVSSWSVKGPDKALLVVDDLDRCHSDQMLSVIESVRVFLDDDEINNRLQVAMLIDREVLANAICKKYRIILKQAKDADQSPHSRFAPESIVEDELEKLFMLRFTLPHLEHADIWRAANKILGIEEETAKVSEKDVSSDLSTENYTEANPKNLSTPTSIDGEVKRNEEVSKPALEDPEVHDLEEMGEELTPDEKIALRNLVVSESVSRDGKITPRQIRSLRSRYFFGRHLMLELFGNKAPLKELRVGLASNTSSESSSIEVRKVIGLVR